MNKLFLILSFFAVSFFAMPVKTFAQVMTESTTAPMQLDEKSQKHVDQAKDQLAKDQKELAKRADKLQKDQAKFDKDKSKGKLSPDKEMKAQKDLEKANHDIEKLKSRIADNEALLAKYKQ